MSKPSNLIVTFSDMFIADLAGKNNTETIIGFKAKPYDRKGEPIVETEYVTTSFLNLDNKFEKLLLNTSFEGEAFNNKISTKIEYYYAKLTTGTSFHKDYLSKLKLNSLESEETLHELDFNNLAFTIANPEGISILSGINPDHHLFRPIIDILHLKVLVNLVSMYLDKNDLFHSHGLNYLGTITKQTINDSDYRDYGVSSLVDFKLDLKSTRIEPVSVCFEDWNLNNINNDLQDTLN